MTLASADDFKTVLGIAASTDLTAAQSTALATANAVVESRIEQSYSGEQVTERFFDRRAPGIIQLKEVPASIDSVQFFSYIDADIPLFTSSDEDSDNSALWDDMGDGKLRLWNYIYTQPSGLNTPIGAESTIEYYRIEVTYTTQAQTEVPEPVKAATLMMAGHLLSVQGGDRTVKSFRIGDYSVTYTGDEYEPALVGILLAPYLRVSADVI